ncbi:MAG: serine/threonine protein kinase [Planctomycetota bacterium]
MKICLSCEGVTDTQAHRCGYCDAPLLSTDSVHYPARRGEVDAGNPLLGTIIAGKYRLQSVLGRGGLGTVFRAQHVGSLVTVALKLLHPRFSQKPEYRRALLPEARRAATVVHERCARLLDVGEGDEGITYLAMELVEGQTLDEVLQQGALSPSHVVDLLLQVTAALTAVHEVGLVHCDLSPRNVMVSSRSGRLETKVLDFGIARSMTLAGRQHAQGELWGFANPAFSAPELLVGGEVDHRADLYSLGTLGWLMLTGTMPVDDTDAERAAAAVREGRLLSWPSGTHVPKRLANLVQRCVRFEPGERPASAEDVHRQLQAVRTGRGPGLARLAAFVGLLALLVTLAASDAAPVSLSGLPLAPLQLTDKELTEESRTQHLRPQDLSNIVCYYSGFARHRLRVELVRSGTVLRSFELPRTPVGERPGTLLLSDAQDEWHNVLESLKRASKKGPVELVFVVPGTPLVRAARVQVDDQPPTVSGQLGKSERGLRADTQLEVELRDDIAVTSADLVIKFDRGAEHRLKLLTTSASFALGGELAKFLSGEQLHGGSMVIVASDAAGNQSTSQRMTFESADVSAPYVLDVTGPAGQRSLARHGDRLRLRVQLSTDERGCRLRCWSTDREHAITKDLRVAPGSTSNWYALDVPAGALLGTASEVSLHLVVVDAMDNLQEREFATTIINRSPEIEVRTVAREGAGPSSWDGIELVIGPNGGVARVLVPSPYGVVATRLKGGGQLIDPVPITVHKAQRHTELQIGTLAAGVYELFVDLAESADEQIDPLVKTIALRVLPAQIQIGLPSCSGRYLKQFLDDGVLGQSGDGYREGRGWRIDSNLRRYVGGEMWQGEFPSDIPRASGDLLPEVVPVSGHNVLSVRLTDVLGRPVRLVDGVGAEVASRQGRQVVADFWWSDAAPQLIREMLLEHGQRARVTLRMPLPFLAKEQDAMILTLSNAERVTGQVKPGALRSIVTFELPFAVWSAAARLTESREAFAQGLTSTIHALLSTPAELDRKFSLDVQTTRSTLRPMRLGDVAEVPKGLADLLLLPVLAPAGEFVEPSSKQFPPRYAFRPQAPVNVRSMPDIMLQNRELNWGEARALRLFATSISDKKTRSACVHFFDPLGRERLKPDNLLPQFAGGASGGQAPPDDAVLAGADFFQAWACTRLLGVVVGNDANLFRLPFGCELELAAYADNGGTACHAVSARGGAVLASAFRADTAPVAPWTSAQTRSFGDYIKTSYGDGYEFVGLDFGVQEWVLDLPHMQNAEWLLVEWTNDHQKHLERVMGMSIGKEEVLPDELGLLRQFGVVRGLAFGDRSGVIDGAGKPVQLAELRVLPATVPGVLRTEQLTRGGKDLLGGGREPRLQRVGFRVAGNAQTLAGKWGFR